MSMNSNRNNNDELSNASQRLRSNQEVLSRLNQFSQASTLPNESIYKMLEYQQQNEQKPSIISTTNYKQAQNHSQIQESQQGQNKKVYQLQRKVQFKQDMGFIGHLVKYILIAFIIALLIDFYFEIQNQIELKTKEVAQCYQDFHENNCLTPLDALVQECKRLQFCASKDPKSMLKISTVFVKTIAGLVAVATDHLQVTGMVFIVVLVLVYLYRPAMYHEEKVYKYE